MVIKNTKYSKYNNKKYKINRFIKWWCKKRQLKAGAGELDRDRDTDGETDRETGRETDR